VTPYERMTAALQANGSRRQGDNWQCPAHDDRIPSLSVNRSVVRETGEPTVLIYCHAGCSTVTDILPALGLDPSDLFPGASTDGVQGELFPASKYSPVGLEIVRMLPPSSHRTFWGASILGRWLHVSRTRRKVNNRRELAVVLVESNHRRAIERELEISQGVLRNDILKWREWGVAHACSERLLAILVRPAGECPSCGASLPDDSSPRKPSLPDDAYPPTASLPDDGFEREAATTHDGFFKGVDGEHSDPGVEGSDGELQEIAPRSRRFEVYPELKALEESRRREDRRKAAGE
jgi:hypothetical protein